MKQLNTLVKDVVSRSFWWDLSGIDLAIMCINFALLPISLLFIGSVNIPSVFLYSCHFYCEVGTCSCSQCTGRLITFLEWPSVHILYRDLGRFYGRRLLWSSHPVSSSLHQCNRLWWLKFMASTLLGPQYIPVYCTSLPATSLPCSWPKIACRTLAVQSKVSVCYYDRVYNALLLVPLCNWSVSCRCYLLQHNCAHSFCYSLHPRQHFLTHRFTYVRCQKTSQETVPNGIISA